MSTGEVREFDADRVEVHQAVAAGRVFRILAAAVVGLEALAELLAYVSKTWKDLMAELEGGKDDAKR